MNNINRICQFPDCQTSIELLPPHHIFCTDHQIGFRLFRQDVNRWLNGDKLVENDYLFLYLNRKGCDGATLSNYLIEIGTPAIMTALRNGRLKGEKIGRRWHIPFDEILRAINLARNWISVKQTRLIYNVRSYSFFQYARLGLLGETRINLSGALAIRIADLDQAIKKYRKAVKAVRKFGARSSDRFVQSGEFSTEMTAQILGISGAMVRNRMNNGDLAYQKRKSCRFTKLTAIQDFVQKILDKKVEASPRVKKRCQELFAIQNSKLS